jgi:hypothetical protein
MKVYGIALNPVGSVYILIHGIARKSGIVFVKG